jgi:hypothetical protein
MELGSSMVPKDGKGKINEFMESIIEYAKMDGYKVTHNRHPKCLGDGIEDCGYNSTISCDECKYNGLPFGGKDPNAKCNQFK